MAALKRTLGVWSAAAVSIGAIIGAGIFVLIGVASGIAGPAVILSFILAGTASLFTALSAAELSSFITESGGSYIYTHHAFGRFWGFVVGWMQSADYIIGASAVSIGFAGYLIYFLQVPQTTAALILIGCLLPLALGLVNLKGMREASGINSLLVLLKVIALGLFVAVGAWYLFGHGWDSNYSPFFPKGVSGMLNGAAVIFFAFVGFNTVTVIAEEVKDPVRNVPRALFIAFAVSAVIYVAVSIIAIGLVNWSVLATSDAPLESALSVATSNPLVLGYVSVAALFATASVVMASIFGGSRALFAMSRQKLLPAGLSRVSGDGVPLISVILVSVAMSAIVLASGGNLGTLAQIFNFGTLMTFFFINLSLVKLRWDDPGAERGFVVPLYPLTPVLGIISCALLIAYLSRYALVFGVIWIAAGLVIFELNIRRLKKIEEMKIKPELHSEKRPE
ncbi:MAG TPA: amino acid permease [Methanoregulaceae archaeon]|nr:amino acid permease [Methanoregulaceae archaeon]